MHIKKLHQSSAPLQASVQFSSVWKLRLRWKEAFNNPSHWDTQTHRLETNVVHDDISKNAQPMPRIGRKYLQRKKIIAAIKILALDGFNTVAGLQIFFFSFPQIDMEVTQVRRCCVLHNRRPLCMGRTGGSLIAGNYGWWRHELISSI